MSKNHEEEIVIKDQQISFEDGQLVDEKAKAVFPIETAVVEEDLPVAVVAEEELPVAVVEEVELPVAVVEEVAAPVVVEPIPDQQYVAPIAEPVHHPVWPWALGALALAGLGTALAWPRPATPVAEPVVTTAPVVAVAPRVVETPTISKTPIPTCDGGQLIVKDSTVLRTEGKETGTEVSTLAAQTPITISAEGEDGWFPVLAGTAHGYVPVTAVGCLMTVTG